jgi:transcriptional regulator with PAS, ATPase and Fis domain
MSKPTAGNSSAAEILDSKVPETGVTPADYLSYVKGATAAPKDDVDVALLATDEKMLRVREIVEQIKNTNVPVLITGESGVGKEVVARAIHTSSSRAAGPFVAVNCAALPSNLLESELFGYEKGAFTGAQNRHIGKFELADNGTLLLDEVTEMDPNLQAKLLRALQEKEIERIGGNGPIAVKTRIIATTNRDIMQAVAQGQFRQDLYYRLHVIQLEIPALRERPRDIEALTYHFLHQYCAQFGKETMELAPDAKAKVMKHSWPGNVRELQNVIQRAVLLTAGRTLSAADLPIEAEKAGATSDWVGHLPIGRQLRDVETQFILETLKHHQGNRTHAAKTLGISLRTLRNKINEFTAEGIEVMGPQNGQTGRLS